MQIQPQCTTRAGAIPSATLGDRAYDPQAFVGIQDTQVIVFSDEVLGARGHCRREELVVLRVTRGSGVPRHRTD